MSDDTIAVPDRTIPDFTIVIPPVVPTVNRPYPFADERTERFAAAPLPRPRVGVVEQLRKRHRRQLLAAVAIASLPGVLACLYLATLNGTLLPWHWYGWGR